MSKVFLFPVEIDQIYKTAAPEDITVEEAVGHYARLRELGYVNVASISKNENEGFSHTYAEELYLEFNGRKDASHSSRFGDAVIGPLVYEEDGQGIWQIYGVAYYDRRA